MIRALDLRPFRVRSPAVPLAGNNRRQVVHTHTCASVYQRVKPVPAKSGAVTTCGWEGNRGPG